MRNGWQIRTLGDVLQKTETVNPHQAPEVEFDYIDVSSVSNATFQIEETQRLTGKDAPSRARRLVRANDVLFATVRPTLHRIAVVPESLDGQVCSTGYIVLRPKAEIDYRFVFYSLFTEDFMGQMESLQKGASYPAVTDGEVKSQRIPVPPLLDQRRIVGVLDEAFVDIAAAKANAEKNLQNARALFDSHIQSVFTQRGAGWSKRALGDLATFRNGINFTKSSRGESVRIVGVKDFRSGFWAPLDNLDTVTTDGALTDADMLREDDLLFVRSNGNINLIGRSLLVGEVHENTAHSGFTIRARLNAGGLSPRFLCHFVKSGEARRQMIAGGTGTNIKSLSQSTLSALVVPIPPIAEQSRIVCQVEAMDAEAQRLEFTYQRKLAALDVLQQSLLHQAFSGNL